MKNTIEDIEEPVKKSWKLLFWGILVLAFLLGIGIFLLVEAFQKPENPQDVLDMKRMLVSGIGVILFSLAIVVFLYSVYGSGKKKKSHAVISRRKPVKRKTAKRKAR